MHLVVPGDINTRTGGYRYDKRIMLELIELGWIVKLHTLCDDFPFPSQLQIVQASEVLSDIPDGSLAVIDGLAFSVMPEVIQHHRQRLELVALIHHPLALETGLDTDQKHSLMRLETQALAHVNRVITTSPSTAEALQEDYHVNRERIVAVLPGTDQGDLAQGSGTNQLNLLCVASINPRKGHTVLLAALKPLLHLNWHLYCAGSTERDRQTVEIIRQKISDEAMHDRVSLVGELDDVHLQALYTGADIFVLASFHEGYGMVLDEAIAHGLPIVCTDAGAMKDTVPEGSGLLVPPGNVSALSNALESVMTDNVLRQSLARQATIARENLRTWRAAAIEFANALPDT